MKYTLVLLTAPVLKHLEIVVPADDPTIPPTASPAPVIDALLVQSFIELPVGALPVIPPTVLPVDTISTLFVQFSMNTLEE